MNSSWNDNPLGDGGFAPSAEFNTAIKEAEHGEDIESFASKRALGQIETELSTALAGSGLAVEYYAHEGGPVEVWDTKSDADEPLVTVNYDHNDGAAMLTVLDQDFGVKQIQYDGQLSRAATVAHVADKLGVQLPEASAHAEHNAE